MTRAASGTPPGQAGLTLVEVMVSLLLVGIAAAFVFSIQVRTSQALRDQSTVAEAQQVLRAASDLIVSDLRQAGYKAKSISLNGTSGVAVSGSLSIHNSSSGPDSVKLQYADTSFTAHIMDTAARNPGEIEVDDNTGFRDGDTILAVYLKTLDAAYGTGCLMTATGRTGTTKVTTTASTTWDDVTCATLASGDSVKVEGAKQPDGSIVAKEVEKRSGTTTGNTGKASGTVTEVGGACPDKTFKLGSTKVKTASSTTFEGLSCATLTNGVKVEVTGTKGADGVVLASAIEKRN